LKKINISAPIVEECKSEQLDELNLVSVEEKKEKYKKGEKVIVSCTKNSQGTLNRVSYTIYSSKF